MKTKISFVFLIFSAVAFSGCGGSNTSGGTQGAGANADGSCNDDIRSSFSTFQTNYGTAMQNLKNDTSSNGDVTNYPDFLTQSQAAKSACDKFLGKFGTTVCRGNDGHGNAKNIDMKEISAACQNFDFTTDCDGHFFGAVVELGKVGDALTPYVNDDGSLKPYAHSNPTGFKQAANAVLAKCSPFEGFFANYSCTFTKAGKATVMSGTQAKSGCAKLRSALNNNPATVASTSIMTELNDIQTGDALQAVDAAIVPSSIVTDFGN